jgi:hypothetical protein
MSEVRRFYLLCTETPQVRISSLAYYRHEPLFDQPHALPIALSENASSEFFDF